MTNATDDAARGEAIPAGVSDALCACGDTERVHAVSPGRKCLALRECLCSAFRPPELYVEPEAPTQGGSLASGPPNGLAPRSDGRDPRTMQLVAGLVGAKDGASRAVIGDLLIAYLDALQPAWLDLKDEADEGQLHKDAGLHHSARKCVCGKWHLHLDAQQPAVDVDALAGDILFALFRQGYMPEIKDFTTREAAKHFIAKEFRAYLAPAPGVVEALAELLPRVQRAQHVLQDGSRGGRWGMLDTTQAQAALRQAQGAE